jgi:hypothetical protein
LTEGGWINLDTATEFTESTHWDGRNHISDNTGSQWEHQALYCTRKGVYILHSWSQWQGSSESWERVDAVTAAEWLVRNGEEAPDETIAAEIEAQEI